MSDETMQISVVRYDPDLDEEPVARSYRIPSRRGLTVLDALRYVWENQDPDLAFRHACKVQRCAACTVMVNGRARLACGTLAEEGMRIEAVRGKPLIRDLVGDIFQGAADETSSS